MLSPKKIRDLWCGLGAEIDILHEKNARYLEEKSALQKEVHKLKELLELAQQENASLKSASLKTKSNGSQSLQALSESESSGIAGTQPHPSSDPTKAVNIADVQARLRRPSITEFYFDRNYSKPSPQRSFRQNFDNSVGIRSREFLVWLVSSPFFDTAVGMCIIFNTFCMAGEMQFQGLNTGYVLGFDNYDGPPNASWEIASKVFAVMDKIFIMIFAIELSARFVALRLDVFKDALNWIDIVAVSAGFLHWILQTENAVDNMLLRMLRLAKLIARCLRLLKLTKLAESLHILVKSISASVSTLFWSIVLLLMFQFVAGMVLSQLLQDIIVDEGQDIRERQIVFSYYGTFMRSQITMFEIHLANFGAPLRIVVDYCGEWYAVIFLAYRCLAGYAVLNVINAVFIQQTIALASRDHEIMFINRQKEVLHYSRDLKRLFKELDLDCDGSITLKEWHTVKSNPDFIHIMNALELNAADTSSLFQLMDLDGDGTITCEELINSALRLRGNARSVDVIAILSHLSRLRDIVQDDEYYTRQTTVRSGWSKGSQYKPEGSYMEDESDASGGNHADGEDDGHDLAGLPPNPMSGTGPGHDSAPVVLL